MLGAEVGAAALEEMSAMVEDTVPSSLMAKKSVPEGRLVGTASDEPPAIVEEADNPSGIEKESAFEWKLVVAISDDMPVILMGVEESTGIEDRESLIGGELEGLPPDESPDPVEETDRRVLLGTVAANEDSIPGH